MADIIPIEDINPEIKTYSTNVGELIIEKTHATPIVYKDVYKIEHAYAETAKIDAVIALWEQKRKRYQDLINKYDEIKLQPKG